jgi:hypothetical protein
MCEKHGQSARRAQDLYICIIYLHSLHVFISSRFVYDIVFMKAISHQCTCAPQALLRVSRRLLDITRGPFQ